MVSRTLRRARVRERSASLTWTVASTGKIANTPSANARLRKTCNPVNMESVVARVDTALKKGRGKPWSKVKGLNALE
jgi:hypothetical protein